MTPTQRKAMERALEYRPSMPIEVLHSWAADMKKAAQKAMEEQPAEQGLVGYWDGEFSNDGGAMLYEVPQVSVFGIKYQNVPLYAAPKPAKRVQLTNGHVRDAGGIVHSDGNVFFTSLDQLNRAIEAAHGITGETK